MEPLSLSGTTAALETIEGKTQYGRDEREGHYLIRHWDIDFLAEQSMDFRVELNTQGLSPGTYQVLVAVFSRERDFKNRRSVLKIDVS